jgi:hypothetical protein
LKISASDVHLKTLISIQDYRFLLWKRKASPLEFQKNIDCLEYLKNIEVNESSCHEEEEETTKKANDERKYHLQIFHSHHKTTENLNLQIKNML